MTGNASSFPLDDRPWILVLDHAGRRHPVSLRQLFAEAGDLQAVVGDLPTQTLAIVRLLLAVLHRAVDGPADGRAWHTLWRSPALPTGDIGGYLDEYRERFDLLHPVTPFYQVANLHTSTGETLGLERLIADVPTGAPYLSSRLGVALTRITPAEAARWVVHCQAYDTSGIKSGAVGDPRVTGGRGYPIGTGWCGALGGVFLEGASLRETLLLNLVPADVPYLDRGDDDAPVWERQPLGPAEEPATQRGPYGLLNLYTWQSRRIRLFGDEEAITGALVANGDKLTAEDRHHLEPMTAWRRSHNKEKQFKRSPVYLPARHDHSRALWRGLEALLPATPASATDGSPILVPPLTQWLARVRVAGYVDAGARVTTRAIGVTYGTQQSVVDEIFDDALTMTIQAFDPSSGLRDLVVDSAADADAAVAALRTLAANLARAAGARGNAPTDAATRAAEAAFGELDQLYRRWLARLRPDSDPAVARTAWQRSAKRTVLGIGTDLVTQAGPAAWAGRDIGGEKTQYICAPLADMWFRRRLNRVLPLAASPEPLPAESHDAKEVPV